MPAAVPTRGALGALAVAVLAAAACSGRGGPTLPAPPAVPGPAVPDIAAYPPVPTGAAPGASARARTAATAIGRGVNFGNMLEAPTEGAWGLTVTDEFIDQAAAGGFTAVRLPVRWSAHAGVDAPYTIDPAFLTRVESVVDRLLARGLVVVLDMHHYHQLDGDPSDPGEVVVSDAAVDVRFVMLWAQIAARFQGRGPGLLFELYNEPHGRLDGAPWNVLAARALGAVRRTNPGRVVVLGPASWNDAGALARLALPNDSDLVVTVHDYAPFAFTHQGAEWVSPVPPVGVTCCSAAQRAAMTAPLDVARAWGAAARYPVYVGEFGAYGRGDDASRAAYARTMRDAMATRGMSWTYWEFAAGFGVYDPAAHAFRAGLLGALLGP